MANAYFQKFPISSFNFAGSSTLQSLVNIIHRTKIADFVASNIYVFDSYYIKDGDTMWSIAYRYYGDTNYIYMLFLSNPTLMDPYYDWPMTYQQFIAFIEADFGTVQNAQATIHHYEDSDGDIIDLSTFNRLSPTQRTAVDNYTYFYNLNEAKRNIQLIQAKYASQIDQELSKALAVNN